MVTQKNKFNFELKAQKLNINTNTSPEKRASRFNSSIVMSKTLKMKHQKMFKERIKRSIERMFRKRKQIKSRGLFYLQRRARDQEISFRNTAKTGLFGFFFKWKKIKRFYKNKFLIKKFMFKALGGFSDKKLYKLLDSIKKSTKNLINDWFVKIAGRLDVSLVNLGFAPSIPLANYFIKTRKVFVNGNLVVNPNKVVNPGDFIVFAPYTGNWRNLFAKIYRSELANTRMTNSQVLTFQQQKKALLPTTSLANKYPFSDFFKTVSGTTPRLRRRFQFPRFKWMGLRDTRYIGINRKNVMDINTICDSKSQFEAFVNLHFNKVIGIYPSMNQYGQTSHFLEAGVAIQQNLAKSSLGTVTPIEGTINDNINNLISNPELRRSRYVFNKLNSYSDKASIAKSTNFGLTKSLTNSYKRSFSTQRNLNNDSMNLSKTTVPTNLNAGKILFNIERRARLNSLKTNNYTDNNNAFANLRGDAISLRNIKKVTGLSNLKIEKISKLLKYKKALKRTFTGRLALALISKMGLLNNNNLNSFFSKKGVVSIKDFNVNANTSDLLAEWLKLEKRLQELNLVNAKLKNNTLLKVVAWNKLRNNNTVSTNIIQSTFRPKSIGLFRPLKQFTASWRFNNTYSRLESMLENANISNGFKMSQLTSEITNLSAYKGLTSNSVTTSYTIQNGNNPVVNKTLGQLIISDVTNTKSGMVNLSNNYDKNAITNLYGFSSFKRLRFLNKKVLKTVVARFSRWAARSNFKRRKIINSYLIKQNLPYLNRIFSKFLKTHNDNNYVVPNIKGFSKNVALTTATADLLNKKVALRKMDLLLKQSVSTGLTSTIKSSLNWYAQWKIKKAFIYSFKKYLKMKPFLGWFERSGLWRSKTAPIKFFHGKRQSLYYKMFKHDFRYTRRVFFFYNNWNNSLFNEFNNSFLTTLSSAKAVKNI